MEKIPVLLQRAEAAQYLGVCTTTLAKWASVGEPWIPYFRIGNRVVYNVEDLDAFLEKRRIASHGEVARERVAT